MKFSSKIFLISAVAAFSAGCGGRSNSDINYVAIGASDATGVGADPITAAYVYLIRDDLVNNGDSTKLINLGIPTAKIHEIQEEADEITHIDSPDLVTVFAGANDLDAGEDVETFQSGLDDTLQHLVDNTDAFIVIATLPDLTQLPALQSNPSPNVTEATIAQYNAVILTEAAKFSSQVAVADLRALQNTGDITASDGFHPNNAGYQLIANVFIGVINAHFFGPGAATTTTTTTLPD